ncbi:hypothetical protein EXS62_00670 [Candidatus Kaiserbacteria bacterium]|nr:hypothetical protein [Candidatus Kaiserbacteria bacterium]
MKLSIRGALRHAVLSVLSVLGGVVLGATLVGAATTISTSITTGGTFNADDTATFGSTVAVTGSTTLASLLNVGGAAALNSTLNVVGATTLASTTATSFKVGQTGTQHTGLVSGYCTIPLTTLTASSTTYVNCTTSVTGAITTSDRIFVQATSSMPAAVVIQAASSTGVSTINIRLLDTGLGTTTLGGIDVTSVNFWAVR